MIGRGKYRPAFFAAQAEIPLRHTSGRQRAGQQPRGRIRVVPAFVVLGVEQDVTSCSGIQRIDYSSNHAVGCSDANANTAPVRDVRMTIVEEHDPAAIGPQNLHGFAQGRRGDLVLAGQAPNLRPQGIERREFLVNGEKFGPEAFDLATLAGELGLWRGRHEASKSSCKRFLRRRGLKGLAR